MAEFYDDFHRADGPIGPSYTSAYSGTAIVSNTCFVSGDVFFTLAGVASAGAQWSEITILHSGLNGYTPQVFCKSTDGGGPWIVAQCQLGDTAMNVTTVVIGGTYTHTVLVDRPGGSSFTCRVEYTGEPDHKVRTYINGTQVDEGTDAAAAAGTRCGFRFTGYAFHLAAYRASEGGVVALSVSPDVLGTENPPTILTLTGTGTAWTSGVPGSPTFTCDAGSFSNQAVLSTTMAQVTFTPPLVAGTVTVTDPDNSTTDTILVVEGTVTPGTDEYCPFDDDFIRTANNTGHLDAAEALLTTKTPLDPTDPSPTGSPFFDFLLDWQRAQLGPGTPSGTAAGILNDLVRVIYFSQEVTPGENVFSFSKSAAADALAAHFSLDSMRGVSETTLQDILDAISSLGAGQWDKLFTQLGIDGQATFPSLLVALLALWGPGRPTLDQTYQAVLAAQTIYNPRLTDLQQEVSAIHTGPSPSLVAILNYLNVMRGDESSTMRDIHLHAADAAETADLIQSYFLKRDIPDYWHLQDVMDKLENLITQQMYQFRMWQHPPVWPGEGRVIYLPSVPLEEAHFVSGFMHGVRVHIESTDPGTGFYDYDMARCWRNIGALAFVTDAGDTEMWQPLGFTDAIYVPKLMTEAAAFRTHLGRGPKGIVTPWRIDYSD